MKHKKSSDEVNEVCFALQVTMEDNKNRRYQDNGCSFVVEVQPNYQNEETEVNKGSSSDDVTAAVTDQQALVHREEIADDRSPGIYRTF